MLYSFTSTYKDVFALVLNTADLLQMFQQLCYQVVSNSFVATWIYNTVIIFGQAFYKAAIKYLCVSIIYSVANRKCLVFGKACTSLVRFVCFRNVILMYGR